MLTRSRLLLILTSTALTCSMGRAIAQTSDASLYGQPSTKSASAAAKRKPAQESITVEGRNTAAAAMAVKIPLKSQYAASHISKAELDKASPVSTMDSVLNTEPSIHSTASGPLGVQNNVTFRAFNSAELSQTLDGISMNDIFNGGASNQASEWNDVLLIPQDISGIDLYRGINNPANNSYNSLAGTINYTSLMPADEAGGTISGTAGSFGTLGYSVLANTGKYDGVADVMSFSHTTSDGWLDYNADRNENVYNAISIDTGSNGKIYDTFVWNRNTGEEAYDIPEPLIEKYGHDYQFPESEYNEPIADSHFMNIVGATENIGPHVTADIKGFFGTDDFGRNAYSNPADQKTGYYIYNADTEGNSDTSYNVYERQIGVQPTVTVTLPYHNTLKVGANYTSAHLYSAEFIGDADPVVQVAGNRTTDPGDELWDEHDDRTEYTFWAQDEIDLFDNKLKITPGVKYLYERSKVNDDPSYDYPTGGDVSDSSHFTAPTIGLSYEVIPNVVLYAAFGENIEFPTIDGYYDNIDGKNAAGSYTNDIEPVAIQPEHVTDYEAGIRYANHQVGFTGALGFYYERFTNTFITATDPTTQLETTTNGGSSDYKGIELQLAEDLGDAYVRGHDIGDFGLYLNYSYNDAYYTSSFTAASVGSNDTVTGKVSAGTPVSLVPQDTLAIGASWNKNGWQATLDTNYVTKEYISALSSGTTSNLTEPAYFVANISLSKTIKLNSRYAKSLKVAFFIDNILDRHYDAYAYAESYTKYSSKYGQTYAAIDEAAPRAFYGTVSVNF